MKREKRFKQTEELTLKNMYNKHSTLRNFGEDVKIFLSNVL